MPSCMRVPPELGDATSGRPSAVARSIGRGDALGGGHADRPGQEVELAGDDGDPPAEHRALAGEDRFVESRSRPGLGQLAAVVVVGGDVERRRCPS